MFQRLFSKKCLLGASVTFPSTWKKSIVTPIPKISNPTAAKDCRPISVLPAMSKILEKVLLAQITEHLNQHDPPLLAKHQSGYRKGHSTTTALAKVTHDILSNLDNDHCTILVLVDFSLAFNCVNHRSLARKLISEFCFSSPACNLISSFLTNRCQVVRCSNATSAELPLTDGTPQGSCLSALLFSLYVNSLPTILKCSYQLYADDLQIYINGPISEVDQLVRTINEDLARIELWSKNNYLSPNPSKTQAIAFSKRDSISPNIDIIFCNQTIPLMKKVKNLGLTMDHNLNWTDHVNSISSKVFLTLRTFRKFQSVLTVPIRLKLVQSIIVPIFSYCDTVYFPGLSAACKDQLLRCYKSAARFVFNLKRRETTETTRRLILGCDLLENYRRRICCFMRQGYDQKLPAYLLSHLQRGRNERSKCFIIPQHTTTSRKSILVYGPSCWNNLPLATRQTSSLTTFKTALNRAT